MSASSSAFSIDDTIVAIATPPGRGAIGIARLSGPEALRIGLVQSIHPLDELKDAALALAHELAGKPPIAVAGVLRAVVGAAEKPLEQALDSEREAVRRCFASHDQAEGLAAFIEKRQPIFNRS